ncbi:amidase family protein [Lactococcus protaetiae]|uniref:Amidase n=1 Tax=Lactococcus protaetiae TaxID=2592653 RepID=A0A514Z735_9LACT|nr:amidase family protein [Lactococcus protaetiae]QDK70419.1 amidase [Lactococcus protaetiae]
MAFFISSEWLDSHLMIKDATYWAEQIRTGEISAADLLSKTKDKIEQLNPLYNAVVADNIDLAKSDLSVTQSGFFAGVPFALKMLGQSHAGLPATASSCLFADSVASSDDNYVKALMKAGLTPFGQTNSPEFGFKNISDSRLYGDTRNVWNPAYYSGGSSGGAASAVASGMFPMAGASDGGGSIRIPASFSGLIGLKMTRGRMPQGPSGYRGWQGASISGSLAVSVRDVANFVAEMQTLQEAQPYPAQLLDKKLLTELSVPSRRLKIAISFNSPIEGIKISETSKNALKKSIDFLEKQGHEVTEINFPLDARALIQSYYRMNAAETIAMLEPWEKAVGRKITKDDVELLTYALLEAGRKAPVSSYINALDEWDLAAATFEEKIFNQFDLFITPTTAKTAPKIGETLMSAEILEKMTHIAQYDFEQQIKIIEEAFERSLAFTPYNFISNLTGQPALSLPVYVEETTNLPQGVQLWGPKNSELLLLQLALEFEKHGQFVLPEAYIN